MIKFGAVGLGPIKNTYLDKYAKLSLKACEIPFTHGVYIKERKHEKEIRDIREKAKNNGIILSIHAPYWVNLNSKSEKTIEKSKQRILNSCKIGEKLDATKVVFHPGFYCGMDKEEAYRNIKNNVLDIIDKIKEKGWKIKLAPETMGKINVFGSDKEILRLVKDTGCSFCIDFAHLLARSRGRRDYKDMVKLFDFDELHTHYSGIEYTNKGEKKHIPIEKQDVRKLLKALPKNKDITIISEDPNPVKGALKSLNVWREINA